ncbi:alkaline phosphatase [Klebsiella pneumoniae]|nr:alkaline phosphatase [Klebsiella pneumoniae]
MTQPDRRHLRRARLALAVVVAAALAAWLWFPGGRTFLQQSLTALASLDPQQVRGFIAAWGPQAALVSFALMILQAIVAPLPAFLITLANAALFGAFWGGALSWFSAMVGAGLCFCIARALGARSGGETHRPRGAAQCRRLFHPLWPADDPGLPPAAVCPV